MQKPGDRPTMDELDLDGISACVAEVFGLQEADDLTTPGGAAVLLTVLRDAKRLGYSVRIDMYGADPEGTAVDLFIVDEDVWEPFTVSGRGATWPEALLRAVGRALDRGWLSADDDEPAQEPYDDDAFEDDGPPLGYGEEMCT